jgi:uncharacterized protein YndB with AHSA1/START domain
MLSKVVEWIDIQAPREEVFNTIVNCDRRLQLSPLWGVGKIQEITPDFPQEGSRYRTQLLDGKDEFDSVVTAFAPLQKFAYHLTNDRDTRVTWTFQNSAQGTRLTYEELFLVGQTGEEEFTEAVRGVVRQWLENIKRYAELRQGRAQRLVKWALDRHILKLPPHQRRIIVMVLSMQAMAFIAFVGAALFFAIASRF